MDRDLALHLDQWLTRPERRPLVVRGARQVGKTWLVRDLAARHGLQLLECNFERDPSLARCFRDASPVRVLDELSLTFERRVDPARTLLFLDEIQAAGEVLGKLRWFAEEMPALPVVAAGSLIEFTLADHAFSMPVGRITYLHVEPLSFPEFLRAHGQEVLEERLRQWRPGGDLGETAFERARTWFGRYVMVGGMPAVVRADVGGAPAREVRRLQHDLLATFRDDFPKYTGRAEPRLLDGVLRSVAAQLGRKFVYSHVGDGVRHDQARRALDLLAAARVCHSVERTTADGLPLGAGLKERFRKAILLDVGLAHALLGTPAADAFPAFQTLADVARGALAEQIVGQALRTLREPWEEPRLHYWQRGGGRPGEIDYVAAMDLRIVPIEIKAGAAGALKSLHQFMHDKGLDFAVRIDDGAPTVQDIQVQTTEGDLTRYRLLTIPHALAWHLDDAVRALA